MMVLKYAHQQGYQQTVKENIDILNNVDIPEVANYKLEQKIMKTESIIKWVIFFTLVVSVPFVITFAKRKA